MYLYTNRMSDNNRHMQARLYTGNYRMYRYYMHQSHSWPIVTKCHNIYSSQYIKTIQCIVWIIFSHLCNAGGVKRWLHDDMVFTNQLLLHD